MIAVQIFGMVGLKTSNIQLLVNFDPNFLLQWSPLMLAARNGHAKVCRMLLGKGASVNRPRDPKTNFTPLMVAIDEGNK